MDLVYRKYKRNRVGACNICGAKGRLTWDHVPPKGGIELQPVEIERVMSVFSSALALDRREISQNCLKFRTLCDRCNNDLLGARFDPALNDLGIAIGRFLRSDCPASTTFAGSDNYFCRLPQPLVGPPWRPPAVGFSGTSGRLPCG